jgi:hypothetical protein
MIKYLRPVSTIVRYVAICNFAMFVFLVIFLGGDAFNGKAESGRYYLGQHGKFTEVSVGVFQYSQAHIVISIVLGIIAMLLTLASRPSELEQKWQQRLVGFFLATSAAYAFFKYR